MIDKAIVFFCLGADRYLKEAITCIESIHKYGGESSNTHIFVYTNHKSPPAMLGVTYMGLLGPHKLMQSERFAHRINKAMIYSDMPAEKCVFVDTDVECFGDFTKLFDYCLPDEQWGVPDGRSPDPMDMMRAMMFRGKSAARAAREFFGDEYLDATNKPTAWNVGVLPMSRSIGTSVGPQLVRMFESLRNGPEHIWKSFSEQYDEQIPLNYILWKDGIKTGDIDHVFNVTKTKIKTTPKSSVIFLHLRHHKHPHNAPLYEEFKRS